MSTQTAPILAGKYHLLRKLGAGGMAEVYLAKQSGLEGFEKLVVIKRILPHLAQDEEFVTMFLDEARAAADLRHPNVVNVFEVNAAQGTYYMAMEFLHGQDIRKIQRKAAGRQASVPMQHACQIMIDAATGLHYAHTKQDLSGRPLHLVHRDISPQNILVTYDGTTKIVDFGIAKAASQETHTATGVIKGKYTYMSPEQAQGEDIDHRSDQFALGVVFWELLTMRRLFKRPTEIATMNAIIDCEVPRPSLFAPDIPQHLEHVVLQCLQKDPDNRFDSCEDLALELEEFLAENSIVHSPARVGHYMRELFSEEIASEADLGKGVLDGEDLSSLSALAGGEQPQGKSGTKLERSRTKSRGAVEVPDAERGEPDARTAFSRSQQSRRPEPPPPAAASVVEEDDDLDADERTRSDAHTGGAFRRSQIPDLEDFSELDDMTATSTPETIMERWGDGVFSPLAPEPKDRRVAVVAGVAAGVIVLGAVVLFALLRFMGGGGGELTVRTTPPGARVFLDGADSGRTTPHVFKDVPRAGQHEVRFVLEGYVPETASFVFGDDGRFALDVPLSRATTTGAATVKGEPTGAVEVLEGPKPADEPAVDEPAVDEPIVEAATAAAEPAPETVAPKQVRKQPKATKPKPARLRIVVKPWAIVYIDGKKVGETPMKPRMLPPGSYEIELKNPDLGKSTKRTVRLSPGDDELIRVNW